MGAAKTKENETRSNVILILKNLTHQKEMALVHTQYERFSWPWLNVPNLVRKRTPMDGSCFFHAICDAYFEPYIMEKLNGKAISRSQIVKSLRRDLADALGRPIDPLNENSPTYYDQLSRGNLKNFGLPEYSLEALQKELLTSTRPVDYVYNEFISTLLNKNIYILDYATQEIAMYGDDLDLYYKPRPSIVLMYLPGHYELVGQVIDQNLKTLFDWDDPLIVALRLRQQQLLDNRPVSSTKVVLRPQSPRRILSLAPKSPRGRVISMDRRRNLR